MADLDDRALTGSAPGSILGTRVQRTEDPLFLTRGAVYTEDVVDGRLAGAVRATSVRSPVAHARILAIDTAAATVADGVVAVLTAEDLRDVPDQRPGMPMYPAAMAQPLLAGEVVRFVGEPVAVVLTFPAAGTNVVFGKEAEPAADFFAGCEVVVTQEIVNQQGGAAVRQAALELIELAKARAAERLEIDPADLVVDRQHAGLRVAGMPGDPISFAELADTEPLLVRAVFTAPGPTYPFGAHVAVVEVDVESGKAELSRLIALDDAGVLVNPLLAEGQRHGGLAQGAAQALLEEVLYDEQGNPTTTTFADYPIVSATEVPSFELVTTETPTRYNPLGAKGIGEAGTIGATPAVHNAVVDAVAHLGVRHIDMPTTSFRVWTAIRAAGRPVR